MGPKLRCQVIALGREQGQLDGRLAVNRVAVEQVTDEQIAAFALKTAKLRMDSTQIGSNIRAMSRLHLLVEVLQRVQRMLQEDDQERYGDLFAPYIRGTSGQYSYHIKASEVDEHLQRIGELMDKLISTRE